MRPAVALLATSCCRLGAVFFVADGFREIYCWLNRRDVLIVKADRHEPLVVLRMSLAAEIAEGTTA